MYKVELIDIERFKNSRDVWKTLVSSMKTPSFFCTWEWVYSWWEYYGDLYVPVIMFIYDDEVLKGILPLALHISSDTLRTRTLSYCTSVELSPDHIDLISSDSYAEHCIEAVIGFLNAEYREWDVLMVSLVSDESNIFTAINGKSFGLKSDISQNSVSPYISISGSFEEFMCGVDGNIRNAIIRKQKKLNAQGFKYSLYEYNEISQGLRDLFHLHELRAKSKNIKSSFTGQKLFDFHSDLLMRTDGEGKPWLRFIENNGKVISAFYGFSFGDRLFYYQIGFDPEWEQYSPGTILMYEVIKEAFSKGYREFDFLRGNEAYKTSWTKIQRPLYSISIYNKTLRADVYRNISRTKTMIKQKFKELATDN
jgi:hypothetical protein